MRATNIDRTQNIKRAVTTAELKEIISCGRDNAIRIATEAGARVQIGRRVLWNVEKIQRYLDAISE